MKYRKDKPMNTQISEIATLVTAAITAIVGWAYLVTTLANSLLAPIVV